MDAHSFLVALTVVLGVAAVTTVVFLAHGLGHSVALGAFIAGSLIAESGEGPTIEHLVTPVRDIFAAIFSFQSAC